MNTPFLKFICLALAVGSIGSACKQDKPTPSPPPLRSKQTSKPTKPSYTERKGLEATDEGREVVLAAIESANQVLGEEVGILLQAPGKTADNGGVPVYLVDGQTLLKPASCFVPNDERCIVVTSEFLQSVTSLFAPSNSPSSSPYTILAIIFLHEAGHIYHEHDGGEFDAKARPELLNLKDTESKKREYRADRFVAWRINHWQKSARESAGDATRKTEAMMLAAKISMLCFDLRGRRMLDRFEATAVGSRSVFADQGYSHPNLELRFLTLQYLIAPSQDSLEQLQDFLKIRTNPPAPGLFMSPDLTDAQRAEIEKLLQKQ